jgi:hypothetical protein
MAHRAAAMVPSPLFNELQEASSATTSAPLAINAVFLAKIASCPSTFGWLETAYLCWQFVCRSYVCVSRTCDVDAIPARVYLGLLKLDSAEAKMKPKNV